MKRAFTLLTAMLLVVSMLVGCGSTPNSTAAPSPSGSNQSDEGKTEQINLTYWHTFTEGVRKDFMDKLIADYTAENPNVNITTEVYTWAMFTEKWTTGLQAGAIPDISNISNGNVYQIYSADALLPLNDVVEDMGRDMFIGSALDGLTVDGEVIALPLYMHAYVLWYRADILDQLGVDVPKTWDEMIAVNKKIREETDYYGFPVCMSQKDYIGTNQLNCWASAYGATLLDENNRANLTDPKVKEVIQFMVDLYKAGSPEGSINYGAGELNELFYTGKSAFTTQSGFIANSVKQNSPDLLDDIKATLYFGKNGENVTNHLNLIGLAGWKHTKHPEQVMDLIKYHYEDERYSEFLNCVPGGMLPGTTSEEVKNQILNHEFVQQISQPVNVIMEAIENGTMQGMNYGLNLPAGALEGAGIIEEMFQNIILNGVSVDEAAEMANKKLQDAMDVLSE
ncbi:MAG: sugar ABC transporter substrate-binding protein [Clostridiaceae bacterium]|nr:sugar ABC transporter substrate-binding protein [Clostridiaceae bacterium]